MNVSIYKKNRAGTAEGNTHHFCLFRGLAHYLNIEVFWDVTPRRLVNSYRRFEEAKCHHIHSPAVPQEWAREEWTFLVTLPP